MLYHIRSHRKPQKLLAIFAILLTLTTLVSDIPRASAAILIPPGPTLTLGAVYSYSLGSVNLTPSRLYALVKQLSDEGFINIAGPYPAGKSGKERLHYTISGNGSICLQEELFRQRHAVKIAETNGLMQNQTPTDIQRLLLNAKI